MERTPSRPESHEAQLSRTGLANVNYAKEELRADSRAYSRGGAWHNRTIRHSTPPIWILDQSAKGRQNEIFPRVNTMPFAATRLLLSRWSAERSLAERGTGHAPGSDRLAYRPSPASISKRRPPRSIGTASA